MGDVAATSPSRLAGSSNLRQRWIAAPQALRIVLTITALVACAAGELALLERASQHAFLGNSDGATVVLEGQSMSHGNAVLGGWDLSLDSFWSLDVVFYALA